MIPIRDVIPSRTTPYVTFSLIIANALAFLCLVSVDVDTSAAIVRMFGLQPATLTWLTSPSLVTAIVLHGSWPHLLGNLLFLWLFGSTVEDRFGHGRFFAFYLIAGIAANLAQAAAAPHAFTPVIGASGAIAAVMGAYFVMFPNSRIVMLIWLVFFVDFVEIPAVLFLGFWLIFQFLGGLGQAVTSNGASVAFVAHIAGFAFGALSGRLLARPERLAVTWWDLAIKPRP
jgi:membrane associated rhomboid family serine protease